MRMCGGSIVWGNGDVASLSLSLSLSRPLCPSLLLLVRLPHPPRNFVRPDRTLLLLPLPEPQPPRPVLVLLRLLKRHARRPLRLHPALRPGLRGDPLDLEDRPVIQVVEARDLQVDVGGKKFSVNCVLEVSGSRFQRGWCVRGSVEVSDPDAKI